MHIPLHRTVTDTLRARIFDGAFAEGDRLPSEPDLARDLGVSRATLREAMKRLETEGLVLRRHGVGTFVQSRTPAVTLRHAIPRSVSAIIASLGFIPGTHSMTVTTEAVYPDDMERLGLPPSSKVVRIERVRTANAQPVAYTIDLIPEWVMTRHPRRDDGDDFSLIEHLSVKCGVRLAEATATLMPLHNIASVADRLDIDASTHIFFLELTDHNDQGTPVMFSRAYFAPWVFRLSVTCTP